MSTQTVSYFPPIPLPEILLLSSRVWEPQVNNQTIEITMYVYVPGSIYALPGVSQYHKL